MISISGGATLNHESVTTIFSTICNPQDKRGVIFSGLICPRLIFELIPKFNPEKITQRISCGLRALSITEMVFGV